MIFIATYCNFLGAFKFLREEKIDRGTFGISPSLNFLNQGSAKASITVALEAGFTTRILEIKFLASCEILFQHSCSKL